MKSIVILGSTGSIGTQTLDVCRMHGFGVKALSASTNTAQLEKQAREFKPEYVCVYSESSYSDMKQRLADTEIKVLCGMEGLCELARLDCDIVVNSVVGMVGLLPTLEAAKAHASSSGMPKTVCSRAFPLSVRNILSQAFRTASIEAPSSNRFTTKSASMSI